MKLIKHEKADNSTVKMEMLLENDLVRPAVSEAYKKEARRYNVPGFRRGKAPRNLIEKMYGEDVFVLPAINDLFPDAFDEAVKELDLETIAQPEVDDVDMHAEGGVLLYVAVKVKPEVNIGKYTGLAATRRVDKVKEDDIDRQIERLRERNARLVTREGTAVINDIATIDYEGSVDGVPFEGGADEGHQLTLGSGQFIPGFEEQVVGHAAGEEFEVKVTFPEEYHSEELAGKDAVFKVKLHEIQYKELPELDDEFAKDISEFDTLEEYKADMRANMQKEFDAAADSEAENKLVEQIAETIEGEIPEEMYDNRVSEMAQEFNMRLQQQGLDLGSYLQYSGQSMDDFLGGFRQQAEKVVKMRLALETVARLEGLVVTDEDIEKEIQNIAEKYEMEVDKVRELMPADEIKKDLVVNKGLEFVKSNAVITDEEPEKNDDDKGKEEKPKKAAKSKKSNKSEEKEAEKPAETPAKPEE